MTHKSDLTPRTCAGCLSVVFQPVYGASCPCTDFCQADNDLASCSKWLCDRCRIWFWSPLLRYEGMDNR